jgi:hypothetical protein
LWPFMSITTYTPFCDLFARNFVLVWLLDPEIYIGKDQKWFCKRSKKWNLSYISSSACYWIQTYFYFGTSNQDHILRWTPSFIVDIPFIFCWIFHTTKKGKCFYLCVYMFVQVQMNFSYFPSILFWVNSTISIKVCLVQWTFVIFF